MADRIIAFSGLVISEGHGPRFDPPPTTYQPMDNNNNQYQFNATEDGGDRLSLSEILALDDDDPRYLAEVCRQMEAPSARNMMRPRRLIHCDVSTTIESLLDRSKPEDWILGPAASSFALRHGRHYGPRTLPPEGFDSAPRDCLRNCARLAMETDGKLRLCGGYAESLKSDGTKLWVSHHWCVREALVVDPTWGSAITSGDYFGIAVDLSLDELAQILDRPPTMLLWPFPGEESKYFGWLRDRLAQFNKEER